MLAANCPLELCELLDADDTLLADEVDEVSLLGMTQLLCVIAARDSGSSTPRAAFVVYFF